MKFRKGLPLALSQAVNTRKTWRPGSRTLHFFTNRRSVLFKKHECVSPSLVCWWVLQWLNLVCLDNIYLLFVVFYYVWIAVFFRPIFKASACGVSLVPPNLRPGKEFSRRLIHYSASRAANFSLPNMPMCPGAQHTNIVSFTQRVNTIDSTMPLKSTPLIGFPECHYLACWMLIDLYLYLQFFIVQAAH